MVVEQLLAARRQKQVLPSLRTIDPSFSHAKAYEAAATIREHRERGGEKVAGRKIGLTNRSAWTAMETDEPFWGYVYDRTLVIAPDGRARVDLSAATSPRIEPEIGLCFRTAVDPSRTDALSLLHTIDWVAPCFEVIDSHFADWKFKAADGIADFGVHYALVVGAPLRFTEAETGTMDAALRDCDVELSRDGIRLERGKGSNTLGHPLLALAAMLAVIANDPIARPLAPGEIVTTGTLTPAHPVAAGQRWSMSFTGIALQPLELLFS